MLGSISLLGERARGRRWGVTVGWLAIGATAAGAALGAVLGAVGRILPLTSTGAAYALLVVLAMAILVDLLWLPRRVGPLRQVNDQWLLVYRGWVAGVGFGVQLGLAVATVVTSATTYVVLAAMALTGDPARGAAIGVLYGAVRAAGVLPGLAIRTTDDLARADRGLVRSDRAARYATVAATASCLVLTLVLFQGG
jgi:hypothetical protein